jgi:pentatricopeptide repeat domain-containing protein 1
MACLLCPCTPFLCLVLPPTGNQWQRAEQLFKDMQVAGCTPDVVTYTALISALERSGRWLRAYQVFQDMTARGCKPDSIVHNAIIDALWQTGCVWAQAKAHGLFMQAVAQGHFRGATSGSSNSGQEASQGHHVGGVAAAATRGRLGGGGGGVPLAGGARWQLNLHALTAGVAMVSLYQWLQDLR